MTDKKRKRQSIRQSILLVFAVLFFLMIPLYVQAADMKIMSTVVYHDNIYVYVRGITELQQDSVVQIGNYVCPKEQLATASLSDSGIDMRTLVLIDNSKSIPEKSHEDIQEIIEGLISSSMENEQFKIGVFSDQITYLCDYTNNKEALNSVVEEITYNDQDTYLSDALYNVISELNAEDTNAYIRVLIFADGADDNAIGFTNDEVRSCIGENAYPIYSVGIPAKNNSSKLEVMFSFSRAAGSEYFLLDGSISDEEIIDCLAADRNGICLRISPDESIKDGGNKKLLLKLNSIAGSVELTANVDMPFGSNVIGTVDEETEPEEKEEGKELPVLKPVVEAEEKQETDTARQLPVLLIVLIVLIVLVIVGVAVLLIVMSRKKKTEDKPSQNNVPPVNTNSVTELSDQTVFMGTRADTDDARELWKQSVNNYLILKDLDNNNIMMKVPIVDKVCIGRGETQDIVIENDKKVSRAHCEIILRGSLLYITDCNSSNGTLYEGVKVYGETPIISGGKIEIGAHRYRVELIKQ